MGTLDRLGLLDPTRWGPVVWLDDLQGEDYRRALAALLAVEDTFKTVGSLRRLGRVPGAFGGGGPGGTGP